MIPRYSKPEMAAIWDAKHRFRIWFEIEALAVEGLAFIGQIPPEVAKNIREKGDTKLAAISDTDIEKINAIEQETRHDVIAFLTWLGEGIGPDSRYIHLGMTSSDVLDTCLSVQLRQATDILLSDIYSLLEVLKTRAIEYKYTPTIGRTHGIHAEPTTFGLKLAGYYSEFLRNKIRLEQAAEEISVVAISGAVGTFAHIDWRVEAYVAEKLGSYKLEPISTQVIPRDRHAAYFCTLAVVASSIERLATEIRHLQRSEVREVEEFFHPGQKGSSAMPHKRNPVLSENLTGLARLIRSAAVPALENVALWHERDISHSSVERGIAPDATIHLDFALRRLTDLMKNLVVFPDRMLKNLNSLGGVIHSGEVLLALTNQGMSREDAYKIVQSSAMESWKSGKDFRTTLLSEIDLWVMADSSRTYIPINVIDNAMNVENHLKNVDIIFESVFC